MDIKELGGAAPEPEALAAMLMSPRRPMERVTPMNGADAHSITIIADQDTRAIATARELQAVHGQRARGHAQTQAQASLPPTRFVA